MYSRAIVQKVMAAHYLYDFRQSVADFIFSNCTVVFKPPPLTPKALVFCFGVSLVLFIAREIANIICGYLKK
jgi:uncharacterized membrane protein YoaT (DUF817 family)